jgi:hypothetical protein
MAIQFSCSGCGNILRVGDEMAGRKGKCPKCGLINLVPFPDGTLPPPPVAAAVPIPPAMAIAPTPVVPTRPPPPPFVDEPIPVTEATPAEAASPRVKKKNKLLLPLLIGGGILGMMLLCCAPLGYFGYTYFFGAGLGSEQKYFPNGTQAVASVRVDQGTSSDFYKQIKDTLKKGANDPFDDKNAEKNLGVPLSNIDRLTFAGSSLADGPQMITMVRTKKSVKGAEVKGNMSMSYKETTINGATIYENDNEFGDSFCVVESDLVLIGKFKLLKAVVERGKKPELSDAMQTALKKADFSKTMAFAVNIKELVNQMSGDKKASGAPAQDPLANLVGMLGKSGPPEKQVEKFARKIESASGSLDIKTDLTINLQVECKDNVTAEDIKKLTEATLVLLKLFGDDSADYPKEIVEDLTTNIKVSSSGTSTTASGTIKGAPIIAFSKKMSDKSK